MSARPILAGFASALLILGTGAPAATPPEPPGGIRYRYGFEMELDPSEYVFLMDLVDKERFEEAYPRYRIPDAIVDAFLDDPRGFDSIREKNPQLAADLEDRFELNRTSVLQAPGWGAPGSSANAGSRVRIPGGNLPTLDGSGARAFSARPPPSLGVETRSASGLVIPLAHKQNGLKAWWRALPREEKLRYFDTRYLTRDHRAILVDLSRGHVPPADLLYWGPEAPPEFAKLDVQWDSQVLELKLSDANPVHDRNVALRVLETLAKKTGLHRQIFEIDRLERRPRASLHLHISAKRGGGNPTLLRLAHRVKILDALEDLARWRDPEAMLRRSRYALGMSVQFKGNFRWVGDSHFESREQKHPPARVWERLERWMAMPEEAAVVEIDGKIAELLGTLDRAVWAQYPVAIEYLAPFADPGPIPPEWRARHLPDWLAYWKEGLHDGILTPSEIRRIRLPEWALRAAWEEANSWSSYVIAALLWEGSGQDAASELAQAAGSTAYSWRRAMIIVAHHALGIPLPPPVRELLTDTPLRRMLVWDSEGWEVPSDARTRLAESLLDFIAPDSDELGVLLPQLRSPESLGKAQSLLAGRVIGGDSFTFDERVFLERNPIREPSLIRRLLDASPSRVEYAFRYVDPDAAWDHALFKRISRHAEPSADLAAGVRILLGRTRYSPELRSELARFSDWPWAFRWAEPAREARQGLGLLRQQVELDHVIRRWEQEGVPKATLQRRAWAILKLDPLPAPEHYLVRRLKSLGPLDPSIREAIVAILRSSNKLSSSAHDRLLQFARLDAEEAAVEQLTDRLCRAISAGGSR